MVDKDTHNQKRLPSPFSHGLMGRIQANVLALIEVL
jgi:hypothetical protein